MIKNNRRSLIIVVSVIASLLLLPACAGMGDNTDNGQPNDNAGIKQNYQRPGQTNPMNNDGNQNSNGRNLPNGTTGNRVNRLNNNGNNGINGIDGTTNDLNGTNGTNGNNGNGLIGNNKNNQSNGINGANGANRRTNNNGTSMQQRAEKIKTALEKEPGVSNVNVLLTGDTAVVGCNTNQNMSQVKNKLTDKAKSVDPTIKNVAVTNATNILTEIRRLSSDMINGNASDLDNRVQEIVNKITPNMNR